MPTSNLPRLRRATRGPSSAALLGGHQRGSSAPSGLLAGLWQQRCLLFVLSLAVLALVMAPPFITGAGLTGLFSMGEPSCAYGVLVTTELSECPALVSSRRLQNLTDLPVVVLTTIPLTLDWAGFDVREVGACVFGGAGRPDTGARRCLFGAAP